MLDYPDFAAPNMDEAVVFFVNVIGCVDVFTIGPFRNGLGDFMSAQLNVGPRAVIPQVKTLRCKNGANIALFEYDNTDQRLEPPRNNNVGGHHIAFYVDDMVQAVVYLHSKDVRACGEPVLSEEGSNAGLEWVHFVAPWGMQLSHRALMFS
jgi:catechol 2,3-dioxygenase-like lactoylglutathione lyase family enzyme